MAIDVDHVDAQTPGIPADRALDLRLTRSGGSVGRRRPSIRTIVLAESSEMPSDALIDLVIDVSSTTDATVVVVHVREWVLTGGEWVLGPAFVESRDEAGRVLARLTERFCAFGVETRGVVRGGQPWQVARQIVDVAEAEDADLLVLGFHRHRFLDEFLSGRVAQKVLKLSDVPVLIVPDDDDGHPAGST